MSMMYAFFFRHQAWKLTCRFISSIAACLVADSNLVQTAGQTSAWCWPGWKNADTQSRQQSCGQTPLGYRSGVAGCTFSAWGKLRGWMGTKYWSTLRVCLKPCSALCGSLQPLVGDWRRARAKWNLMEKIGKTTASNWRIIGQSQVKSFWNKGRSQKQQNKKQVRTIRTHANYSPSQWAMITSSLTGGVALSFRPCARDSWAAATSGKEAQIKGQTDRWWGASSLDVYAQAAGSGQFLAQF